MQQTVTAANGICTACILAFLSIGSGRQLAKVHIPTAQDMVFALHLSLNFLLAATFGTLSSPDVILAVCCLLEPLYARHRYFSLSLFMLDKLVRANSHLSTG